MENQQSTLLMEALNVPFNGPVPNPFPVPARPLRLGDRGLDVMWVQWGLVIAGYSVGVWGIDGVFGSDTLAAVENLQYDLGIVIDGVVGIEMRAVLNAALGNPPASPGLIDRIADISVWQGEIDWSLAATEVLFAIIRVQNSMVADILFENNAAYCNAYRIPFGVYAFMQASSEEAAREEAILFYLRARESEPKFYVVDVELQTSSDMRGVTSAFVQQLRALGVEKIGLYIAHHQYELFNLDTQEVDFIWLPRYGTDDGGYQLNPLFPCDLHQFTSNGRLAGVTGPVDLNRLTGRMPLRWFIT